MISPPELTTFSATASHTVMSIDPLAIYYLQLPILTYTVIRYYHGFQLLPTVTIYCVNFIAHCCPLGHTGSNKLCASYHCSHMQLQ